MANNMDPVEFEGLLFVKNHLLMMTKEELADAYKNIGEYKSFISVIICMMIDEPAFLYIDESITDNVRYVLGLHRFEDLDSNSYKKINGLTNLLNQIDSAPENDKKRVVASYMEYQKSIRSVDFDTSQDFLYSLGYDAFVYLYLRGEIEELPMRDNTLLLASIDSFVELFPAFFENERTYRKTIEELDTIRSANSLSLTTYVVTSKTKKKIKNIVFKGE